jgi:nitrogen PTS system EIIA component
MRIADMLQRVAIEPDLRASNKPGVLRELVGVVLRENPALDPNLLVDTLTEREKVQSTGIGDGVAIPHGRTDAVTELVACVGRSVQGVDFQSLDDLPTHLFVTLFVPQQQHVTHLKALARITRLMRQDSVREALLEAADGDAMYEILMAEDARL